MESVRSRIRAFVGYRSWFYRVGSSLLNTYFAFQREGFAGLRLLAMRRSSGVGVWLSFRHLLFPIFVRPGSDDVISLVNNVLREEYGQMPRGFRPDTVLDAGAYIGDTTAYFLSRFPDARVIALEPYAESFRLARQNLAKYDGRAVVLQKALWDSGGTVRLAGVQTGAAISEHGTESLTITVRDVLGLFGVDHLDLVKMDVEGAETTVLRSGVGDWLRRIRFLLLETHGHDVEAEVIPLLQDEGFSVVRHRNVWYCRNQRFD